MIHNLVLAMKIKPVQPGRAGLVPITIHVRPEMRSAAKIAAIRQGTTLSAWLTGLIERGLKEAEAGKPGPPPRP